MKIAEVEQIMSISTFRKHATLKSEQNAECHWSFKRFKRTIWTVEVMPWTTGKDLAFSLLLENILYAWRMDPSVKLFKLKGNEMPPNVVLNMLMLLSSKRLWRQKVNTFPVKFHSQKATSSSGTHLPNLVVKLKGEVLFSNPKEEKEEVFCVATSTTPSQTHLKHILKSSLDYLHLRFKNESRANSFQRKGKKTPEEVDVKEFQAMKR